jgi:hypothetical protein
MGMCQKSVPAVIYPLSGAKNGKKIGKMLSTAVKNVVASEAHNLYPL